MKLVLFDDFKLGLMSTGAVVDLSQVVRDIPHTHPHDRMSALIENFDDYREQLNKAAASGRRIALTDVRLRPPLPRPHNIIAMQVNYMEGRTEPALINAFHKSPGSVIGPGDTMVLPDIPATIFEGEAELGVVIGKRAANVKAKHAMEHVFGYVNFIDGSARGLPPQGNNFYQMKSRDTFAPLGPCIVTADEIADPHRLQLRVWINGVLTQDFSTSDMAHDIPHCIEWLSAANTLQPGDVIATGTDHAGLAPFQNGDVVEVEIDGLGRLQFSIRDDLRRAWAKETRGERKKRGLEGPTLQLTGKYAKV